MKWTHELPKIPGWYWYKEAGKNMDKPMPVLAFDTSNILYTCRFGADEVPNYREVRNLEDCPGLWWGPVDVPG